MKLNRKFVVRFLCTVGAAVGVAGMLGLGGVFTCSSYPTLKNAPFDCTAVDGYEFTYFSKSTDKTDDAVGSSNWWTAGDRPDGGGEIKVSVQSIPERCGSKTADELDTSHYNDWGSMFGYNSLPTPPADAEGIAFWARTLGDSSKGFTLALDDNNTGSSDTNPGYCVPYNLNPDGGTGPGQPATGATAILPDGTQVSTSGSATFSPYPEACGNSYTVVALVTGDWVFYTIPFSNFQQSAMPNRVPNERLKTVGKIPGTALLTDHLRDMILRFPKESNAKLQIDNLAYYHKLK